MVESVFADTTKSIMHPRNLLPRIVLRSLYVVLATFIAGEAAGYWNYEPMLLPADSSDCRFKP